MKALKIFFILWIAFMLELFLLLFNGCSNSLSPQSGNFSMSFKGANALSKTQSDSLLITSADILIKDLKLKGTSSTVVTANDDSVVVFRDDGEKDDEVELRMGPFVISLNLNGNMNTVAVNNVPPGTYVGAKFEIHKFDHDEMPADSVFADSLNGGYSVVVKGFYNGSPFVFKTNLNAQQRIYFDKPVVVTQTNFVNVTLVVNPYAWFTSDGHIIDPTNSANQEMINWQIRKSFRSGFEDNNKLGRED